MKPGREANPRGIVRIDRSRRPGKRYEVPVAAERADQGSRSARERPWRLRGVPTPVSRRISTPRFKPQTCLSRRLSTLACPRRSTHRNRPVS